MAQVGKRGKRLSLILKQGSTLGPFTAQLKTLSGIPVDLTGAQVRACVRKGMDSVTEYDFTCQIVDAVEGRFRFFMPAAITTTVTYLGEIFEPENQYVWDLEIEFDDDESTVIPVFYGPVKVAGEATK